MIIKLPALNFILKITRKNTFLFVLFGLSFLLPKIGHSQSTSTTVYWSSGWCSICGGSSYACNPPWSGSGNWNNGIRNFGDPIPAGCTITNTCVTVNKADCGYGTMCVSINGININCAGPVGDCWCGNCWPQTFCLGGAIPGYNYGGTNSVQITISGGGGEQAVCVSSAVISFNYSCCTQSVNPSGASASPNPVCAGGSTTLSVSGGSLGTGASWRWYTGGCPGSLVGTGASISVSPGSTTTYYVRAEGSCNNTICQQVTVNVNASSSGPSSASASPNQICGGSSTLTEIGGSLGVGASYRWYTGGCGGTFVGSGSSISVSPSSTTTYYVRAEGTCNNTPCQQVTVNVSSSSSAPSSASASPSSICNGGTTTLTQNGGSLGTGASYLWYSGACGGTFAGSGSSINVSPGSTTTYYVLASGTCNTTACAPVNVTVNSAPVATASPATQTVCSGSPTSIALSSSVGGTNFTWAVSQSGVSGASNGSGASINQILSTTGNSTGTVLYTVTPSASGCSGNPIIVTVIVNPIPNATAIPSTQIICGGGVTSISLNSNVAGTAFNWTVFQTGAAGAASGSGSTIAQTIVATGNTPGTAVYTITPATGSCTGAPITATVTVNPIPVALATPSTQTICSGDAPSIALTSTVSGTLFNWTANQVGTTGASNGSGSTIAQTLLATGSTAGTVTYTVTPSVGVCTGIPILVTITVNPKPVAAATPASQTFCSGGTSTIALSSTLPGTIFSWTVVQTGVTGAALGNGSSISQTLTVTGTTPGTAVYTVTPSVPGGCVGNPINITVTVNPIPVVSATPASQTVCSGAATSIALTSTVAGTTYSWTESQTGVTGATAAGGATIAQTLTATGTIPGTVVYTVTPTSPSGCVGSPITVIVTVNPSPVATATPSAQTICSGDPTSIALTANIPGTTFSWTVIQAGVSGASPGSGISIAQTLSATGSTSGTATYTITPALSGCNGAPIIVIITVKPQPVVTATPPAQSICSGATTAIALTSNVPGTTFAWTVSQSGVSGATPSSGSTIAQTLTLTGSSSGSAIYTITPTVNGCTGNPLVVTITVNRQDNPAFNYASATYCQIEPNPTPAITGLAGGTFTAVPAGLVFVNVNSGQINLSASSLGTYAVTYHTNGTCPATSTVSVTISGVLDATFSYATTPPICQYGSNLLPTFPPGSSAGTFTATPAGLVFVNPGTGEIDLTLSTPGILYTVTNTIAPSGGCAGDIKTSTVIINTAPIVTATPAAQTLCSGSPTSIALTSTIPGTTFSWTVVQTGVSGAVAGNGASIAQTLSTTGTITGTAVYTIIPTTPGGCPGLPITETITVNPVPVLTTTPAALTICSGSIASIALTSNVLGTFFSWTVTQTGVTGAAIGSGASISQTLTTSAPVQGTAVYIITPLANGCSGTPVTVTITVNPVPVLTPTPATQTICSGDVSSISLTGDAAGTTFAWTFNQTNASGASDGNGAVIAQILTATSTVPGIVTYTTTPTAGACSGTPVIITVQVNPRPVLTATPPSQSFCSFGSTSIALSSNVTATTYAWTVAQTGVTGAVPGNGSVILQALSTTGNAPGTAIYTITPTADGCTGTPVKDTVTVNPIPDVTATPTSQTFCSGGVTSIALTGSVAGTVFSWTAVQAGVSGASSATGAAINQTLSTTGPAQGTAVYSITPSAHACLGSPISVTITVNPRPVAAASPISQTICSGETPIIPLTSDISGTTFIWTVTQTGATGASGSNGTIISQTLTATGITAGRVIYSITPTAGPCPGTTIFDTVTVSPRPVLTATPPAQTICSGFAPSILLTGNVAGTTFIWTAGETDVSGATIGTGDTIAQVLHNISMSSLPGTAIYTVTPSAGSCAGTPVNIPITVLRTDNGAFSYTSGTYCQSAPNPTPTITGLPGGVFSSTPAGLSLNPVTGFITTSTSALGTYALSYTTNGPCPKVVTINMTITLTPNASFTYSGSPFCQFGTNPVPVFSPGASAGIFTSTPSGVVFVNVNTGEIDLSTSPAGTYLITNTIPQGGTCPAQIATFTITINPAPTATATPSSQTICTGSSTSFVLTSTMPSTLYSWSIIQIGASGGSAGTGPSIVQTLTTTGLVPGIVEYTVTPTAGGCAGLPINVNLTVNPIPNATAVPSAQIICSGNSTAIALTSDITGTTFAWTVVQSGTSGAAIGSGPIIAQTLATTGAVPGTAVYTITPTAGGCTGPPISVTITVDPLPSAIATPTAQTLCSGDSTSIALTSNVPGTTFTWTAAQSGASGASAGNGTHIVQVLSATFGSTPGTVTYAITPSVNGCPGAPTTVIITVNPKPTATASPSQQTICSGTATSISLTSTIPGTTFAWTVVQTGASGAAPGTGQNIVQTITATGSIQGTAVYTIRPTVTATGCIGIPIIVTVTVDPTPVVTATPASQTICSGNTTSIALSSNVTGTTFAWTESENNVTGAAAGNGASIAQTLTASVAGTALYIVTPLAAGCQGLPVSVTVTVKPSLIATAIPSTQTICSGTAPLIVLTSNVAGTTFLWTAFQTGVTGASPGINDTIAQTLTATGTTAGTVVYTVTPTAGACTGTPIIVTITVDPPIIATATPSSQSFCTGGTTNILLTSNVLGTAFSWTVVQTGVTGGTPSTGTTIAQTLSTTGPVNGTAVYTITPTANGCIGTPITATITVKRLDSAAFVYPSATYCLSGADPTPIITGLPGIFSSTTPPFSLSINPSTGTIHLAASALGTYTVAYTTSGSCPNTTSINVTINSTTPSASFSYLGSPFCQYGTNPAPIYGAGASAGIYSAVPAGLVFVHVNTGEIDLQHSQPGTYTVTNFIPVSGTCASATATYSITIIGAPAATATPPLQTICSLHSTLIVLTSSMPSTTYAWTVLQSGVSGASAGSNDSILQTLSTTGFIPGTAVYTIIPTAGTCPGHPITATITVDPCPIITAVPSTQVICSGNNTSINITSNIAGTTFAWTQTETLATGASNGTGPSIVQTLTATGTGAGHVTYNITPTVNGCVGIPVPVTITVDPLPVVTATPTVQTICSGDTTLILLSSTVAGTTFSWTASEIGVTGSSSGTNDTIAQILTATSSVSGTVTYIITPIAAGSCPGLPTVVTITVNPDPILTATPTVQVFCSGGTTAVVLHSNISSAAFSWTTTESHVTGASAGTGAAINQTLTATDSIPGTAIYMVTPRDTITGCNGTPVYVNITVNPIPVIRATPKSQTICSGSLTGLSLTSDVSGTSFSWTVVQSHVTGASAGSGATIAQTLAISGALQGTAIYTITPTGGGCTGNVIKDTITVNSMDSSSFSYSSPSFCQTGTDPAAIIAGLPGGTFSASPGLVLLDTLTGLIDVSASSVGTFYVRYKTHGQCSDTSICNVTITAAPGVGFSYADTSFCQFGINPTPTLATGAIAGTFSATPAGLVFVNVNTGEINLATSALGSYTIKNKIPPNGGCGADSAMRHVNIIPLTATATPHADTICSGSITSIHLTSSLPNTTYTWTVVSTNVTGANPGSDSVIAQTLTATTLNPGTAVYTITPTSPACVGLPITVTVTVNPLPAATATPTSQTICSDSSTAIHFHSTIPGTTFSWTVAQTGVTGAVVGTDSIISQVLTATGSTAGTAVYSITPSLHGCAGNTIDVTVTVNPSDNASFTYTSATYCQSGPNETPSITGLPGGTFSATPAGLSIDPATGTINVSASTLGAYTLKYTTSGTTCPNSSSITMTIGNTNPSASFSFLGSPYCPSGTNPFPTFASGSSAGVFSASPSGLVFVNVNTGQIDLTASTPGTYTVTNNIPVSGTCLGATATNTVTISALADAAFTYSSATYCQSGPNEAPVITGMAGGTFSSVPAGLSLTPSSGVIDLATSQLGIYTLTYTTTGTCPGTSSITMTIGNTTPSAVFSFAGAAFCQNGSNPSPVYTSGSSAGTYTASPAGLVFVNVNTGQIDLSASTAGTYLVTNTIPVSGTCLAAHDTTTVTISHSDNAAFTYSSATYCQSGINPTPSITGLSGGTFSATPAGLAVNSSTGSINLSASSLGTYTLTYSTNGSCPGSSSITMTIGNTTPSANFSFAGSPLCASANNPFPVFSGGSSAGSFTASPAGLVFVNVNTGEINMSLSTPGTYTITNTIPVSGSCLSATASSQFTITPSDNASFQYSSGTYCQSGTDQTPVITGVLGGTFTSSPAGLVINASTGVISLSTSALGTYALTYHTNGICPNSSTINMTIGNTNPSANFSYAGSPFCQSSNDPFPVYAVGASAGLFTSTPAGLVFISANTGQIDLSASAPGTYNITNSIPLSGTCLAASATTVITISSGPVVTATPSTQKICTNSTASIVLTSSIPGTSFIWTVNQAGAAGGTPGSGSPISQTLTTTTLGEGVATYIITATANGCPGTQTIVHVNVNPLPSINNLAMIIKPANCADSAGAILGLGVPQGQNPLIYQWKDSLGNIVGGDSINLRGVAPGKYQLTVTDSTGCSKIVGPFIVPSTSFVVAAFTASPTTGQTPLTVNFTNSSTNATNYLWHFGLNDTSTAVNPTYTIVPSGKFIVCLTAYNAAGCFDTACTAINVGQNSVFIVPNVFTPNGDDINDLFTLNSIGLKTVDAEIFNRWGEKIFEWHTTNGGWDGRSASGVPASAGTYYYTIRATGFDGKEYFDKGSFSLVREQK